MYDSPPVDIELPIRIEPQPDDTTCGPTCLHAVYRYYGDENSLGAVIRSTPKLDQGGTLAVFLACDALRRGYKATIYTYNLQMFDPSWFAQPGIDISAKLHEQAAAKDEAKFRHATDGYLEYLQLGGKLRFSDLTTRLIRGILRRQLPILTGLSSTYLYRSRRLSGPKDVPDDIHGSPCGHFVVLAGYHRKDRTVLVADPYLPNPVARGESFYSINIDRVICAILLGVLTYDANLLVIHPPR
ncbi:MAG: hypothetical protein HYY36_05840 [Gammaproteobacteria bacterium]|nr:hypothetical protein [Gammaproteobacteria bacterium]